MSADLLAEFGGGSTPSALESTREQTGNSQLAPTSLFDEFEPAGGPSYGSSSLQANPPETELQSDFYSGKAPRPSVKPEPQNEELWQQDDFGNDVLFDAATEEAPDDDDWGEFESADLAFGEKQGSNPMNNRPTDTEKPKAFQRNPIIATSTPKSVDLLSDHDDAPVPSPPANAVLQNLPKESSKDISQHRKQASLDHNVTKLPDLDDEWGDFADATPDESSANLELGFHQMGIGEPKAKVDPTSDGNTSVSQIYSPQNTATPPLGSSKSSTPASVDIRPVNIPPPFVILQIFTPILEQFHKQASVAKPAQGNPKERSKSLDSSLGRDLVCTLRVAARVIAGRTLRWKRDTALSQSTKIGPARSGKSGGMKLSSVNKSESIKEEKEAMDVLEAWRSRAGLFNSVILAAGHQIPLVSNNIQARPASADEGALKAGHACALCGLKRDERIPKIDEKVEDSFGEWWIDHWGHTDCKNFWDRNSSSLNQRY